MKLLPLVLLLACATAQAPVDKAHPVYVGHSLTGEPIVASSHYDAMNGSALATADGEKMICDREVVTGSHVPKWVCRFPADVEWDRVQSQNLLQRANGCSVDCKQ